MTTIPSDSTPTTENRTGKIRVNSESSQIKYLVKKSGSSALSFVIGKGLAKPETTIELDK